MSPEDRGPCSCQAFALSLPRPACWRKPRTRLCEQRGRLKWQFLIKRRGEKAREVMLTDVALGTDAINDCISFPGLPLPIPTNQVARNDRDGFPSASGGQKSETKVSHKDSWGQLPLPASGGPRHPWLVAVSFLAHLCLHMASLPCVYQISLLYRHLSWDRGCPPSGVLTFAKI